MVKTYRLYASVTASANAAAELLIRRKGNIVGIGWHINPSGSAPATGDYLRSELSFQNTAQPTVNDATGIVSVQSASGFLTTSGAQFVGINNFEAPMRVPVQVGDKLFLNTTENGGTTWIHDLVVHIDE